jgi:tyrosine-protein kinase Etk/Wzc
MDRLVWRMDSSFGTVAAARRAGDYPSKILTQCRPPRAYARYMTAPTPPSSVFLPGPAPGAAPLVPDEPIDVRRACGFLLRQWRTVAGAAVLALAGAAGYVLCAPPVYSASILLRVDSERAARVLAPAATGMEPKPEAGDEMEVLRSRLVLGAAVDDTRACIEARVLRTPLVGAALARAQARLAALGIGEAPPAARIEVTDFSVPAAFEDERFVLTVGAGKRYTLSGPALARPLAGQPGVQLRAPVAGGALVLTVAALEAPVGERFVLVRRNRLETIEALQRALDVELRGKQSNLIGAVLEGSDAARVAATMEAIGRAYLGLNGASRAGEAGRRAAVIEAELPRLQQELEAAESRYNAARHSHGTVDSQEETRTLLQRSVLAQEQLETLRRRREQMAARFTPEHPEMAALAEQLRGAEAQLADVKAAMGRIPKVEQDVQGLARDVKVRTDAFAAMLAAAQQLRIESASPLASVRLVDGAELPVRPVRPRAAVALPIAALAGLLLGVLAAWLRQALSNRVADPFALERQLGLPFSALVPHVRRARRRKEKGKDKARADAAAESMRRFAAVLGPAMGAARNNIVLLSGPAARAGASFVAEHLAAALAASGSRVLLVEAGLHPGQLAARFQLAPAPGLAELAAGAATAAQAIRAGGRERFDILPAGAAAAEMPGEPALGELLAGLEGDYDYVLVDAGPALAASSALALGRHAGAAFAVVRANLTTVDEVGETVRLFGQAGVPLAGFIFNDADTKWLPHRYRAMPQPLLALERAP